MPLTEAQKGLAFATLCPLGCTVASWVMYKQDPSIMDWYKGLKKPSWILQGDDSMMLKESLIEAVVLAPTVYAATEIWKKGTENADVRCALATYGALYAGFTLAMPCFYKRSFKLNTSLMLALSTLSLWLTHKFKFVDPKAGWLTVPMTAYCFYGTFAQYKLWCLNEE